MKGSNNVRSGNERDQGWSREERGERMWDMTAASSICLFQHEPCGFITFFGVTVVMHVTACDVRVIPKTNCTTTRKSKHKSASIAKLVVPAGS